MKNFKFVSAKRPSHYGDQLHDIQQRMDKLKKELKELAAREKQLSRYLHKFSHNEAFIFDSDEGYQKVVKFKQTERMVMDQERVRQMLKRRTPYKLASGEPKAIVDYVYVERSTRKKE